MKLFIIIVLTIIPSILFTQTDSLPKSNWSTSAITGLNISQIALSNWTQGGDNSLAWTFFSKVDVLYSSNPWALKNNLKLAFGSAANCKILRPRIYYTKFGIQL